MADILKNEFMWEKKQEKKKLYKNWKLYASVLGILIIGSGTGLGIYYGVKLASTNNLDLSNQGITNAINKNNYQTEVVVNSKASDIIITAEFIQEKLTGKIKTVFDANLFHFNKITINKNNLQDNDLVAIRTINNAKINYDYGTNTNQEVNLTINITPNYDNEIGKAIANSTYITNIEARSSYQELQARIKTIDYKTQLSEEFKNQFNAKFLTIGDIKKENNEKITNEDLEYPTEPSSKLLIVDFTYNNYQATFNLELIILAATTPEDKQNINDAIKNHLYQGTTLLNTPVSELMSLISSNDFNFIKSGLPSDLQSKFRAQYFEFGKVYLGNRELQDSDLAVVHDQNDPLNLQVEFKYPNSNANYDRFNAKLIVIDNPEAIDKYRVVQEELTFIDARDLPLSFIEWKNRAYEQIKTILNNHALEFNQEEWILNPVFLISENFTRAYIYMIINYLSLPTFERQIAIPFEKDPVWTEFNNLVQEALKNYQFQDLANYEQEIKNIITIVLEKLKPTGGKTVLKVSDWKITKKDGYIEIQYQPLGLWIYEPIQVPYN